MLRHMRVPNLRLASRRVPFINPFVALRYQSTDPNLKFFQHKQQREEEDFKKYQDKQHRKSKRERIALIVAGVITVTGIGLYWFQPWHQYSSTVAGLLRKALWAESIKEEYNYKKALKYYQDALKECRKEGVDQLSKDYTGIVLKVAQMYEKLGMVSEQRMVYKKLSEFLFSKLVNNDVEENMIDEVMKRDLSVATRLLEISEKGKTEEYMAELWDRIRFAEQRITQKWFMLAPKAGEGNLNIIEVINMHSRGDVRKFARRRLSDESVDFLNKWFTTPDWPPFMIELLLARDLYGTLCMVTNRYQLAVNIFKSNILWMKLSQKEPVFLGTALSNLASSYYLKMERHELNTRLISERIKRQAEIKLKENHDNKEKHAQLTEKEQEEKIVDEKLLLKISDDEAKQAKLSAKEVERVYKAIYLYYDGDHTTTDDLRIQSSLGMANYGLGVLKIHQGKFEEATSYFEQAKDRAKKFDMDQLVEQVDTQLALLKDESKLLL